MATVKALTGCSFHTHNACPAADRPARPRALTWTPVALLLLLSGLLILLAPIPACAQGPVCTPPPSGMVSWWPGDGAANDLIGGNPGTMIGATFAAGMVGQAFSFDGVNDYTFVPNTLNIDGGAQATYDAWVFPRSAPPVGNYYSIFGAGDSTQPVWTTQQCRLLYFGTASSPPGTAKFYMDCGTSDFDPSYVGRYTTQDYPINNWYAVAGVFNNGALDIYVNGVLDNGTLVGLNSGTVINTNANNYVWIGAQVRFDQSLANAHFDGLIDEVEIFNRSLTASEIQAIYNAGSAGKCKPAGIPTLSEWAQIGMAALLVGGGLLAIRRQANG